MIGLAWGQGRQAIEEKETQSGSCSWRTKRGQRANAPNAPCSNEAYEQWRFRRQHVAYRPNPRRLPPLRRRRRRRRHRWRQNRMAARNTAARARSECPFRRIRPRAPPPGSPQRRPGREQGSVLSRGLDSAYRMAASNTGRRSALRPSSLRVCS